MKASVRFAVIGLVCVSFGYFAYARRFQLAAKIWHWRHGYSVMVRNYQVPVPDGWLVQNLDERDVTMTRNTTTGARDFNFLTVYSPPAGSAHLDAWKLY